MRDLCVVALTGRLTKDPELRSTAGGTAVCSMRVAYSTARKDESGQWTDKSNYIDVTVFGNRADTCAQYLAKGRQIAVQGRLEWREWESQDGSGKRQAYEVVADSVVFLGSKGDGGGGGGQFVPAADTSLPASTDDDIPFKVHSFFDIDGRGDVACSYRSASHMRLR